MSFSGPIGSMQFFRVGRPECEEIHYLRGAEIPRFGESDAAANGRIVDFRIGRARIQHHKECAGRVPPTQRNLFGAASILD